VLPEDVPLDVEPEGPEPVVPPGLVLELPAADDPNPEPDAALFSFTAPVTGSLQCVAAETSPPADGDDEDWAAAGNMLPAAKAEASKRLVSFMEHSSDCSPDTAE